MLGLNQAFYIVSDKIVTLMGSFITIAKGIGYVALTIALCSAAINYALTGTGLKENIIKILKATVFFFVVIFAYPNIVNWIITTTYEWGRTAYDKGISTSVKESRNQIANAADTAAERNEKGTYGTKAPKSDKVSEIRNPNDFFSGGTIESINGKYPVVAPAAVLKGILLVAGECIRAGEEAKVKVAILGELPDFGMLIKGYVCAFAVVLTGIFAVLEYLIAYMEFLFVSSVGIILFPLSLWDGSKFMAEKFISALIGFFIKLLFCTICIFMALSGFLSLAELLTKYPFTGLIDEIIMILFTCLLLFYLCKSAPAMAQSLLAGTPSLNAAGAVGAAASAVGAAAGVASMAGKAGKAVGGGIAKTAFAGAGMITQASAAAGAVKELGGTTTSQIGAFVSSLGSSAKEGAASSGGELVRSLLGGSKGGAGGADGSGAGINRHSQTQQFLNEKNSDGTKQTFGEHLSKRKEAGTDRGIDYMARQEDKKNKKETP